MVKYIEKLNGKTVSAEVATPSFDASFDAVVVGLGTAGVVSAVVLGRKGYKVLGVERMNASGGTMTLGGVGSYYFGGEGGIYEELDVLTRSEEDIITAMYFLHGDARKIVLDRQLKKASANVMYDSIVIGVFAEGRKIIGVRVFDGEKAVDYGTKAVIDATGEADICDILNCETTFGRKSDGGVVPFTIVRNYYYNGNVSNTNHDSGKFDQRDPFDFSRGVLEGQKGFVPLIKSQSTLRIYALPGIREGRLLMAEKRLSAEDFLNGKLDPEPVMYAYADLDKHGSDVAFDIPIFKKWDLMCNLGALNVTIPVPKECIIAKEYDNFCVAGRMVSVDHELQTCVRMNRDMQKLGEVAAVVVASALKDGVALKNVEYSKIKPELLETGCLNEENNKGFRYDGQRIVPEGYKRPAKWLADEKEICESLSTLVPGVAMWSCRILGDKIKPRLKENLKSQNENLKKHSAIALAVMDDDAGLSVLRSIVAERDRTFLTDMRKNNKCRLAMAICGLGILGDKESVPLLKNLLFDRSEPNCYEEKNGCNEEYYRVISIAAAALMEIGDANPTERPCILNLLKKKFADLRFINDITEDQNSSAYVMAKDIYENVLLWEARK